MTAKIEHAVHGDRVLITAEFPRESLTSDRDGIAITLDDQEWSDVAKRVLREYNAAERALDAEAVVHRVEQSLTDAVSRALNSVVDPEIARRRAVAGVLHRIGDMVVTGTIRGCSVEWASRPSAPGVGPTIDVWFETSRLDHEISLSLLPASATESVA